MCSFMDVNILKECDYFIIVSIDSIFNFLSYKILYIPKIVLSLG